MYRGGWTQDISWGRTHDMYRGDRLRTHVWEDLGPVLEGVSHLRFVAVIVQVLKCLSETEQKLIIDLFYVWPSC